MLAKAYRLKRRQAFDWIYQRGKRLSGNLFTLYLLSMDQALKIAPVGAIQSAGSLQPVSRDQKLPQKPQLQVAFVVSRKVSRRSVDRNRIKRRLRAAMREILPHLRSGYWLILSARQPMLQASWPELQAELQRLISKAKLWQEILDSPTR